MCWSVYAKMGDASIDKVCIVDLSQPIYAAPTERVCAVELQPRVTEENAVAAMHLLSFAVAGALLIGVLLGGLAAACFVVFRAHA
jgi:hypothetical protein